MVRETLEKVRFLRADPEVMQLDLRLSPRKRDGALESRGVVVLVGEVERLMARGRDQGPKRHTRRGPRRNPYATAEAEDRIEHRPD
jgi:hypothetical protein